MNCRNFDRDLPDWIAGRLSAEQTGRMLNHHVGCPQCRRAAAAERAMRQRLEDLPLPALKPEIGARLAQRLAVEHSRPSIFSLRRPDWALGGAVAAVGLLFALLLASPPHQRPVHLPPTGIHVFVNADEGASVDESLIVQKISEFQQLPDAESEDFISNAEHRRLAQRTVLLREGAQ
jgi:hypothetical protein